MQQSACTARYNDHDAEFSFAGEFDGVKTFKQMYDLMPPIGSVNRIALVFSNVSRIKLSELQHLFAEMAAVPHFNSIEISIEGLECCSFDGTP